MSRERLVDTIGGMLDISRDFGHITWRISLHAEVPDAALFVAGHAHGDDAKLEALASRVYLTREGDLLVVPEDLCDERMVAADQEYAPHPFQPPEGARRFNSWDELEQGANRMRLNGNICVRDYRSDAFLPVVVSAYPDEASEMADGRTYGEFHIVLPMSYLGASRG